MMTMLSLISDVQLTSEEDKSVDDATGLFLFNSIYIVSNYPHFVYVLKRWHGSKVISNIEYRGSTWMVYFLHIKVLIMVFHRDQYWSLYYFLYI